MPTPSFTVRHNQRINEGYYIHVIDDDSQTDKSRTWNWGDGTVTQMTGLNFWPMQTHRYESPGTYQVTLSDGTETSAAKTITVEAERPVTTGLAAVFTSPDNVELQAQLSNHDHFSITDGTDTVGGTEEYDLAGPSDESWRSNKWQVHNLSSQELFVYGYERSIADTLSGQLWKGDTASGVEQSWVHVGSDAATTFVVSLADDTPITDVVVYPKNICNVIIAAGAAIITVPYNKRVRVEANGDRVEALHIFNNKLKSAAGGSTTDWTTKVSSVAPAITPGLTTGFVWSIPEIGTTYGVGDQFRALFTADTMPTILAGKVRPYEILTAEVVSASPPRVVKLIDHDGTEVEIDSDGSGHKLSLVDHTDTVNTLYFPAGVHQIGRAFRLADDVDVYLDKGAVVIGTFDFRLRNADGSLNDPATQSTQGRGQGITVRGPGILSGSFVGRDELDNGDSELNAGFTGLTSGSSARSYYSMFYNEASGGLFTSNSCKEITVVAQPYHLETGGAFSIYDNFQIVAPWYYNADGPQLYRQSSSSTGPTSIGSITDSFLFCGDDCLKLVKYGANLEVSGCFILSVGNSPMSGGYWPRTGADTQTVTVSDCDILAFGHGDNDLYQNAYDPGNPSAPGVSGAPLGSRCLFRAMTDGAIGEETYNATNYTVDNIRVWGASTQRPFCIGNIRYPFGGSGNMQNQRDQRGYADNITLSNWYFEHPFTQQGVIDAYDADNKPSNITISNWNVAGTLITSDNYDEWFTVDSLVDDMTWDAPGTVANLGDTSPETTYSAGTYTAKVRASNMTTSSESTAQFTSPASAGSLFLTPIATASSDVLLGPIYFADPFVTVATADRPFGKLSGVGPSERAPNDQ